MAQTMKTSFEPHSWALCLGFMMVVLVLLAAVCRHILPIPLSSCAAAATMLVMWCCYPAPFEWWQWRLCLRARG